VLLGAVCFGLTTIVTGGHLGPLTPTNLSLMAFSGCGPVAAGALFWQASMRRGPIQRIAVASYLTPVLSTIWLACFAGAAVTSSLVVGLVLVLVAAALPSADRLLQARARTFRVS
jgi:drug/metabolite transporter (DMT)-like permease